MKLVWEQDGPLHHAKVDGQSYLVADLPRTGIHAWRYRHRTPEFLGGPFESVAAAKSHVEEAIAQCPGST